jgi:REP element-mobilizing transposase RayT
VWYKIRTRVNNREPLFRRETALAIFARVFRETKLRFVFEIRALHLEDDWLTFYIRPADGLELPVIMKWLKQVFAQRYNRREGRIGHIWGDRYWSRIMAGEVGEESGEGREASAIGIIESMGVRPFNRETARQIVFLLIFPLPTPPKPG